MMRYEKIYHILQNLVRLVEGEALAIPDAAVHPRLGCDESLHGVDVGHQLVPDNLLRQSCVTVYVYQHDADECNKHLPINVICSVVTNGITRRVQTHMYAVTVADLTCAFDRHRSDT